MEVGRTPYQGRSPVFLSVTATGPGTAFSWRWTHCPLAGTACGTTPTFRRGSGEQRKRNLSPEVKMLHNNGQGITLPASPDEFADWMDSQRVFRPCRAALDGAPNAAALDRVSPKRPSFHEQSQCIS